MYTLFIIIETHSQITITIIFPNIVQRNYLNE